MKMIYEFPELPKEAIAEMPTYGLKIVAEVVKGDETHTCGDLLVSGSKKALKSFCNEVLGGYQLSEDYLTPSYCFDITDPCLEEILHITSYRFHK